MFKIRNVFEKNLKTSLIGLLLLWIVGYFLAEYLNMFLFHVKYDHNYYPVFGLMLGAIGENLFYYYYFPKEEREQYVYDVLAHLVYLVFLPFLIFSFGYENWDYYIGGILSAIVYSLLFFGVYFLYQRRKKRKLQNK